MDFVVTFPLCVGKVSSQSKQSYDSYGWIFMWYLLHGDLIKFCAVALTAELSCDYCRYCVEMREKMQNVMQPNFLRSSFFSAKEKELIR